MVKSESDEELLFAFQQEFAGSLLMFFMFFPMGTYLGETTLGWTYHFIGVFLFDVFTSGASANPAVCFALYLAGKLDAISMFVRIIAELFAAFLAFPLLSIFTPAWLMKSVGGPELGRGISSSGGFFTEMGLSYAFCFVVLVAVTWLNDPKYMRPLFATVLRLLMVIGGPLSGASFNPMIAIAWAWHSKKLFSGSYHYVYSMGPIVGGALAAIAFTWIAKMTQVDTSVHVLGVKEKVSTEKPSKEPKKTLSTIAVPKGLPVESKAVRKESGSASGQKAEQRGRSPARSKSDTATPRGKSPSSSSSKKSAKSSSAAAATRPRSASRGRSPAPSGDESNGKKGKTTASRRSSSAKKSKQE